MSLAAQWILTYLLHSTVLLGGAALLRAMLRTRGLALQEAVLRAALLGGFLTASLQVGPGVEPLGGVLRIDVAADPALASVAPAPDGWIAGPLPEVLTAVSRGSGTTAPPPSWRAWRPAFFAAWALVALVGLVRLGVGRARLRRLLHPRAPVADAELEAGVASLSRSLGLRRPVPVRAAARLDVPLASGVLRPAVYLPIRAVEELPADARLALCAHELAHVARRDPLWLLVARVVEVLVPLQPLHVWARRRLQDLAELLSDDLAVSVTARPRRLARSLVDVASWTLGEPAFPPGVASGALSTRSRLGHRVERLMDPLHDPHRPRRLLLPLASAAVAATALLTPVVSGDAPARTDDEKATSSERSGEARRDLEELSERIRARAESRAAEAEELQARMRAADEQRTVDTEQIERLEADLERAVSAVVDARVDAAGSRSDAEVDSEVEKTHARVSAARDALREALRGARMSAEEQRELAEAARAMAERVRPTAEELAQLRRLSRELEAGRRELHREMLDLKHELGRERVRELRESLSELEDSLRLTRESMPDVRRLMEAAREAAREMSRALDSAVQAEAPRDAEDLPPHPPEAPHAPHPPEAAPLAPHAPEAPAAPPVPPSDERGRS